MGADVLRDRRRHHAGREDRGRNEDPRAELEITVRDAEPSTSMRPGDFRANVSHFGVRGTRGRSLTDEV